MQKIYEKYIKNCINKLYIQIINCVYKNIQTIYKQYTKSVLSRNIERDGRLSFPRN